MQKTKVETLVSNGLFGFRIRVKDCPPLDYDSTAIRGAFE